MKITTYYKILDINNKCYIGKTTQKLKYRISRHKNKKVNTSRSKLLDLDNCIVIELLKIIPKDKEHSKNIEKKFIRSCPNCVNNHFKRTLKEQQLIKYDKKDYQNNKEQYRNYAKKSYYKNHEKNKLKKLENSRKNKNNSKKYYEKNKEILKEKRNTAENKEKQQKYQEEYRKTYFSKEKKDSIYKSIVLSKNQLNILEKLLKKKIKIINSPYKFKKLPVYKLKFLENHFKNTIKKNRYDTLNT